MATPTLTNKTLELGLAAVPNRDEDFAAKFLGKSIDTMRYWRRQTRAESRQIGPRWFMVGKTVRYSVADLIDFATANPSTPGLKSSTTKGGGEGRQAIASRFAGGRTA